jgi:hypothetical protein
MRMWMVDPIIMCRQHLLGEHLELHMFVGTINAGKSLTGYTSTGLCEVHSIKSRHEALVAEMIKRGYRHNSPLPDFTNREEGAINLWESRKELLNRCSACLERFAECEK